MERVYEVEREERGESFRLEWRFEVAGPDKVPSRSRGRGPPGLLLEEERRRAPGLAGADRHQLLWGAVSRPQRLCGVGATGPGLLEESPGPSGRSAADGR